MKHAKWLLSICLLLGLFATSGCGKQDEQTTRFNKTLGDTTVGVPTAPANVDEGILQDPANYKPATYEPLVTKSSGAATGGGDSPETDAIFSVFVELGLAMADLDIGGVLDSFVPEQVAAYRDEDDYIDNFDEMSDVLRSLQHVLEDKLAAPGAETGEEAADLEVQNLEELGNYFIISVLDEENAVATLDLSRIEIPDEAKAQILQLMQQMSAGLAQLNVGNPGGEGGGATPPTVFNAEKLDEYLSKQIPIPMRKVEDAWRIVLPFTIAEVHADLLNDIVLLVTDICRDLRQTCDQAETLDQQAFEQILTQTMMRQAGALMGLFGKAMPIIMSLQETMAAEAETDETGEDEEP